MLEHSATRGRFIFGVRSLVTLSVLIDVCNGNVTFLNNVQGIGGTGNCDSHKPPRDSGARAVDWPLNTGYCELKSSNNNVASSGDYSITTFVFIT